MSLRQALRRIRSPARANEVLFNRHARERLAERRIQVADVLSALRNARSWRANAEGEPKWDVLGPSVDGADLGVVVAVQAGVVVVAAWLR